MNDARVSRVNPWLVVALVVGLLGLALIAAVIFALMQPQPGNGIGGMLQGPQQMAPVCNGSPGPC